MPWQKGTDQERAIELFKTWYVKPLDDIDADGGFVVFIVAFALYERLIIAKLKLENSATTKPEIKRKISADLCLTDHERSKFWNLFRDGLLHEAMPYLGNTGFIFHPSFTELPKLKYCYGHPVFCIDPRKFYQRVVNEFLNNPHLIASSGSAPIASVAEIQFDKLTDMPPQEQNEVEPSDIRPSSFPKTVTGVFKKDQNARDGNPLE